MSQDPFRIAFAIFPGLTHLDFTGPHQVFARMPGAEVIVASRAGGAVTSAEGLTFANTVRLSDVASCDLICVPGGATITAALEDSQYLDEVKRLAGQARYITSVCTGSLVLGAAGLLAGKRAACHWTSRDLLPLFGAIPDEARVVRDGNVITGGGVTAGIDFALTVVAEVAGEKVAETVQLALEYAPLPPFDAGRPETASSDVRAAYSDMAGDVIERRRADAERAAANLASRAGRTCST